MQQALRPETGSVLFGSAANRLYQALVAGVTVAGAGLIAVGPSAPALPGIQERAVKLTSVDPSTVFSTAETNLQDLITAIDANPDPVGTALTNLVDGYESQVSTAVTGIQTGLTNAIDGYTSTHGTVHEGLAATLQTIESYASQGDLYDAYATLDYYSLESLEGITRPIQNILDIPGEISGTLTNVIDSELTFNTGEGLLEGFTAPLITATVEATQAFDGIEADFADGDTTAALTALDNAPSEVLGAFLNGDTFTFAAATAGGTAQTEAFPGLLSVVTAAPGAHDVEYGGLQELLVILPQQLAVALDEAPATSASAAASVLDPTLLTDITASLDPTSLLDAINPTDLITSLVGAL